MRYLCYIGFFVFFGNYLEAQYHFSGQIDNDRWQNQVYLSVIEDYRRLNGIDNEQIISKVATDAEGYFQFTGNQLDAEHKIYKLHVDNCPPDKQNGNHFSGHCSDSKDILFIAKNTDTIGFPLSFEAQMFCDIRSTNPKTASFIKIDSLKEEMKFAYSEFRSRANRELNDKKWFKTLQDTGKLLNEPLAELYIYTFLSERGGQFRDFYLRDLKSNPYYDELLSRMKSKYPNSAYAEQYEAEIASDRFIVTAAGEASGFNWTYLLVGLLVTSLLLNLWFVLVSKRKKVKGQSQAREQLTKQEQNVLDLLLKENSNKDIADALFVSVSTVKTHVNNVYRKLNVNSRDELKSLFNR